MTIKVRKHDMIIYREENFRRYNKDPKSYRLNYIDSGFIHTSGNWIHKRRFLERHEMIYVTEGELYIKIDGENFVLGENNTIIIPPFKTLTGTKTSTGKTSFYWVNFTTDSAEKFEILTMEIQEIKNSEFKEIFEKLVVSSNLRDCSSLIYDSYLIMIFDALKNGRDKNSGRKLLAIKVNNFIEENISKPLTVESIAEEFNYNKDYLCKVVRQYYGIPLKDYINRQKMNLAKRFLLTSNYPIKEIAAFVGYDDSNLFTKFFKYHIGRSPLEYRKSNG